MIEESDCIYVDVQAVLRETEKAFLFVFVSGESTWFPKSQIYDPDNVHEGDIDVSVGISEWIAEKKGMR